MGVGSALRGGLGFLTARRLSPPFDSTTINTTPANAVNSIFHRHRELPLPISPVSVLRSMVQLDDIQALLWAWTLVGLFLLVAFWSNPSESSFRPFLTDFIFRERLRILHDDTAVLVNSAERAASSSHLKDQDGQVAAHRNESNPFATSFSSTAPFALSFGTRISLSVRTPPYHRKDLGLFSVVTISHSMPVYKRQSGHHAQTGASAPSVGRPKADGTSEHTSVFVGAFGKWWVIAFGMADFVDTHGKSRASPAKEEREELEENRTDLLDWGVLEIHSAEPESDGSRPSSLDTHSRDQLESATAPSRRGSQAQVSSSPVSRPVSPSKALSESSEVDAAEYLSLASLLGRSRTEVLELQEQLSKIRATSATTCEALETELEEIRNRKRDDEESRLETKTRTKALDDSKRQVDASRRQAERRLKAANTARSLKQNSIAHRKEQMETLNKRRAALSQKSKANYERRALRSEEISSSSEAVQTRISELETEIAALRQDIGSAEETLTVEKSNLQAAHDLARWRESHKFDPQAPAFTKAKAAGHTYRVSQDPPLNFLPYVQDPLVDSLARMEAMDSHTQPAMAPFSVDMYGRSELLPISNAGSPHPSALKDSVIDKQRSRGLGTNVLRNAFRRANPNLETAGVDGLQQTGPSPTATSANLQSVSDFEAIKQAFQPSVASEEDGRRSWSAFDMWQSDIRGARHRMQWAEGTGNASADSLPRFAKTSDFLPLDRSTSADNRSSKDDIDISDAEQLRNVSKMKRAFRWPFRPSQAQEDLA
ncbi:hypothetical protein BCV70DRAFT_201971 [Testicularia cyperi]|uniref:Uncharacterized protein n=1 Tax=Testicularia cyperi TaxID=1882483 RepID=A0A317XK09_9BASI|nr:hypothetical protein BCV70DRAFT_201971 [Testicularia cyperi]